MRTRRPIIQGLMAMAVPMAAAFLWVEPGSEAGRLWPLLRSEYRLFLLDAPKAQAPALSPALFRESLTVGHLIALRARPGLWSEDKIRDLSHLIVLQSREFGLSPLLVLSLIDVESRFDPKAVSPRGAVGLMQLMPNTAAELAGALGLSWNGPEDLHDPELNLRLGLSYFKRMQERFETQKHALAAYNIGPGALVRKLANGEEVSSSYYEKVMSAMRAYKREARAKERGKSPIWL